MKKIFKFLFGILMLSGFMYLSSCEDALDLNYEPYRPEVPVKFTYTPKEFYPQKIELVSDTPVFKVTGVYTLTIDSVHIYDNGDCVPGNFSVDVETGVITYNNTQGTINPGRYALDMSIKTVNSVVKLDTVYSFTIFDVPVSISADPAEVTTGALQQGVISTISYTDESPEQNLVVESYDINPFVQGFSINSNGEIVKSTNALPNSTDTLSILVNTNLGSKSFKNVVIVHVGPPPTILYSKASDGDTLKNVIMSPSDGYSTKAPQLSGMNADGGWEVIVADTVPQEVKDALSIDANGIITFKGSAIVPDGVYTIGVKVTNSSGVSFEFKDLFTFTLKTKWGQTVYADKEFGDGTITYAKDPGSASSFGDGNGYAKGYHGNGAILNSWFIAKVPVSADWNGNKLLVSFDERNGWGPKQDPVYAETVRTLQFSYDQASWTDIMAADDSDWPTSGSGGFNSIKDQETEGIETNHAEIYFKWHYDNSASSTLTKSVWMIDNLTFKYTVNYDIIEE